MPAINLPNGGSAILYSADEISERTSRTISRASDAVRPCRSRTEVMRESKRESMRRDGLMADG